MTATRAEKPYYIDEDIVDEEGTGAFERLCKRYYEKCLQVFWGRNRNVFDMGTYVVKVQKNFDGITDNDWEGSVSNGDEMVLDVSEEMLVEAKASKDDILDLIRCGVVLDSDGYLYMYV